MVEILVKKMLWVLPCGKHNAESPCFVSVEIPECNQGLVQPDILE